MDIQEAKNRLKQRIKDNENYKMTQVWLTDDVVAVETILQELEEKDKILQIYTSEREYIKNNLEIDLNRKGVYSQVKGQISTILNTYKENDVKLKELEV